MPNASGPDLSYQNRGRIAIVVQARMTSTRLPGKVLMPVLGRPLLAYQVDRLRRVPSHDVVVIATTANATDDPVAQLAADLGCVVVRGSEHDVLNRYQEAARAVEADVIVRSTADEPLIDPEVVERLIQEFLAAGVDYAATFIERPTWPTGLDVEVFSRAALDTAAAEATDQQDREHVTLYIRRRPRRFRHLTMESPVDLHRHRWTVDTPADLPDMTPTEPAADNPPPPTEATGS